MIHGVRFWKCSLDHTGSVACPATFPDSRWQGRNGKRSDLRTLPVPFFLPARGYPEHAASGQHPEDISTETVRPRLSPGEKRTYRWEILRGWCNIVTLVNRELSRHKFFPNRGFFPDVLPAESGPIQLRVVLLCSRGSLRLPLARTAICVRMVCMEGDWNADKIGGGSPDPAGRNRWVCAGFHAFPLRHAPGNSPGLFWLACPIVAGVSLAQSGGSPGRVSWLFKKEVLSGMCGGRDRRTHGLLCRASARSHRFGRSSGGELCSYRRRVGHCDAVAPLSRRSPFP